MGMAVEFAFGVLTRVNRVRAAELLLHRQLARYQEA